MKKAVAYARYSSDNQRQESIEAQVYAIKEYCESNNLELIKLYQDEAVSGTTDDREAFMEMIDESSHLQYELVIVHKLDRFARNRYDSAINKKALEKNGKRVVSVLENLDDSPESIMLESVLDGMAEYYSVNLAREVRKGLDLNARKGIHNGGKPPYGYDVVDTRLVPNQDEARIVNDIFNQYLDGYGLRTIADIINERGLTNKFGRPFNYTSIYYMLRNKRYIGVYEYQPQPRGQKRNNYYKDDKRIVIEDNHEPIISDDLWSRVQVKIGEVKPRMKAKNRVYYLTGKITCAVCGSNYHGGGNEGKRFVYTCSNRQTSCNNKKVNADKLEQFVIDKIQSTYLTDDMIKELSFDATAIIKESLTNSKREEALLTKKIKDSEDKMNKLFDAFLSDTLDKKILEVQSNRIKSEIAKLEDRLNLVRSTQAAIDIDSVSDYLISLKNNLFDKNPDTIKRLFDIFVNSIVVKRDSIEITMFTLTEVVGGSVQMFSPAPINQNTQPSI